MSRTVLLDNEAVQALLSVAHPKHAKALAHIQVTATRKAKGLRTDVIVPTAVRAEAGWDLTAPASAFINLLGIRDSPLDRAAADVAASIVRVHHLSVADAHLGATVRRLSGAGPLAILTSDPGDMRTAAGTADVVLVTI